MKYGAGAAALIVGLAGGALAQPAAPSEAGGVVQVRLPEEAQAAEQRPAGVVPVRLPADAGQTRAGPTQVHGPNGPVHRAATGQAVVAPAGPGTQVIPVTTPGAGTQVIPVTTPGAQPPGTQVIPVTTPGAGAQTIPVTTPGAGAQPVTDPSATTQRPLGAQGTLGPGASATQEARAAQAQEDPARALARAQALEQAELLKAQARRRSPVEFYIGAKAEGLWGQGDAIDRYARHFGAGAEFGFEVYGFELWADVLRLGEGEHYFTVQVGADYDYQPLPFLTLSFGGFTGPSFFVFPSQEVEGLSLSDAQRDMLIRNGFPATSIDKLLKGYLLAAKEEAEINRFAVGYNVLRLRFAVEYEAAPILVLGGHLTGSYHYLVSGEAIGDDLRYRAIQELAAREKLTPKQLEMLKDYAGAQKLPVGNLGGVNFQAGFFLRLIL